jgi:formylglycine-generating enzyme
MALIDCQWFGAFRDTYFESDAMADAPRVDGPDADDDGGTDAPRDGADDGPDVARDARRTDCPTTSAATPMVRIDYAEDGGSYCIDMFEVTNAQFFAFLTSGIATVEYLQTNRLVPAVCTTDVFGITNAPASYHNAEANAPAASMSWCWAYAYCKSVGKRLCGRLGGGMEDDSRGEWETACQNGAFNQTYPYGVDYEAGVCNIGTDADVPTSVHSYPACHGRYAPYDQICDMVGNIAELIDMASDLPADASHTAGEYYRGSSWHSEPMRPCGYREQTGTIDQRGNELGIRCCADIAR